MGCGNQPPAFLAIAPTTHRRFPALSLLLPLLIFCHFTSPLAACPDGVSSLHVSLAGPQAQIAGGLHSETSDSSRQTGPRMGSKRQRRSRGRVVQRDPEADTNDKPRETNGKRARVEEVEEGLRDGRVTLIDEHGVQFVGRIKDGERHGRGTIFFPDGSWQSGTWENGNQEGPGQYFGDDGSTMVGNWVQGSICGHVEERDGDGFLTFSGVYQDDVREGWGTIFFRDGGRIEGDFEGGALHGSATYFYPDGKSSLRGQWEEGDMISAKFYGPTGKPEAKGVEYTLDESSKECFAKRPLLRDPYETSMVEVRQSRICGTEDEGTAEGNSAAEGLFMRRNAEAGELVSFYNGIRIPHKTVDRRPWRLNGNCISLDEDHAIDVPEPYDSTENYAATLGHKANHSFENNAEYSPCFHPRFGYIKSIKAIKPIRTGEEILVHYGYTNQRPKWYLEIEKRLPTNQVNRHK